MTAFNLRQLTTIVVLLCSWSCIEAGDRTVTTAKAGEGATCRSYCEQVEDAACEHSECALTCENRASYCEDESQELLECLEQEQVSCRNLANGQAGPPVVPKACKALADAELTCVQTAYFDPDYGTCSTSEHCTSCCQEQAAEGYELWFEYYGDCLCADSVCGAECAGWCKGAEADATCSNCENRDTKCAAEANARCRAGKTCNDYLECLYQAGCDG